MNYLAFSLNGSWEMNYQEETYEGTQNPWTEGIMDFDMFKGQVNDAVPGYWEDMGDKFAKVPFYTKLRINPEYGIQRYPISHYVPDMALPNVVGNFFYRKTFMCDNITVPVTLHFDGVQNAVSVWLNDIYLGRHEGYSTPFDIEIPKNVLKEGENTVVLSVSNHRLKGYNDEPVSGLTSRAANECTGGITGNVELRLYNCPLRGAAVLVADDCKSVKVEIDAASQVDFEWAVYDGDTLVKEGNTKGNFDFKTDGME
ncbi:MAG: beta galactosidase jelly roll domain-containing protein, partial [Clostridia bacterium]|nr:beta galactosidase jelly roll domain-containing protein [Clostridia bacterium]